eukprot:TRINITY_DN5792_c0_g2_i2.p1 TRINITY_DN5792_c0_g2~~TRINITY_DN5792_c0_g2_i2.p1  ORF type:complete len:408 (-),score=72.63 TRINITY_DN5792_c0_g2_i2:805-2004(-)
MCIRDRWYQRRVHGDSTQKIREIMQTQKYNALLDFTPEVRKALDEGRAVVALESTIITHGMEYPTNRDTALGVEKIIRDNGAVPATIAIIEGRIKIGLTEEQIEFLSKNKHLSHKCSVRDLAAIIAKKGYGSTTVAATMYGAWLAGIPVFVTGGIGGVHRGAESTFDISADLTELGRTPVAVVSAGAKSILDIPKTLEYLETQGVPVVGYKTDDFPMFFISKSGCKVSARVDSDEECARLVKANFYDLQLRNGILISVPVPAEEEADGEKINKAIEVAINEANEKKIDGAAITPYLLKRINEITGGESSKSNVALIKNNAGVGARVAVKLAELRSSAVSSQENLGSDRIRVRNLIYHLQSIYIQYQYITIQKHSQSVRRKQKKYSISFLTLSKNELHGH